jgi:hypothetical protein
MTKLWLVGLAACGGRGAGVPDSSRSVDAEVSADAPRASDKHNGRIEIFEEMLQPIGPLTLEAAEFTDTTAVTGTTERVDGPCVIRKTNASSAGTRVSAGTVTIAHAADVVTLSPDAANKYTSVEQVGMHYATGDLLTISGTGATVPARTGAITFPAPVTVTAPPSFSTSGYDVAWTGTGRCGS